MEVQALIHQLSYMPQADAERKLEEYGKELIEGSQKFSNAKATFREMSMVFLQRFPPAFSDDFASNMREYDKLLIHSLRSENKDLLLEWGIKYPQSKSFSWTTNPQEKQHYINALTELCEKTPGAEEYFNYLIHHLK